MVVAEVELSSEDETIKLPSWIKEEVTSDEKILQLKFDENPYKKIGKK